MVVLEFTTICALACCGFDTKVPINYVLLTVFTAAISYLVGLACYAVEPLIVLEAASLTAAMTVGLSVYAITTKSDFTMFGPLLFVVGFTFSMFMVLFFAVDSSLNLVFCAFGVVLFSFYLVYDTQIIVGGKHRRFQISEERYILAAVTLYLDIINLFLYLLDLLNR